MSFRLAPRSMTLRYKFIFFGILRYFAFLGGLYTKAVARLPVRLLGFLVDNDNIAYLAVSYRNLSPNLHY